MPQKLLKVGSSAAVTIPKKSLKELCLKIGDEVRVAVNAKEKTVIIEPISQLSKADKRIARLTLGFINRYRKDLEALARK